MKTAKPKTRRLAKMGGPKWARDSLFVIGARGQQARYSTEATAWIRGGRDYWIRIDGPNPEVVVEIRRKILAALNGMTS